MYGTGTLALARLVPYCSYGRNRYSPVPSEKFNLDTHMKFVVFIFGWIPDPVGPGTFRIWIFCALVPVHFPKAGSTFSPFSGSEFSPKGTRIISISDPSKRGGVGRGGGGGRGTVLGRGEKNVPYIGDICRLQVRHIDTGSYRTLCSMNCKNSYHVQLNLNIPVLWCAHWALASIKRAAILTINVPVL